MTTREEVLKFFRSNPNASVEDCVDALKLTKKQMVNHLHNLRRQGKLPSLQERHEEQDRVVLDFYRQFPDAKIQDAAQALGLSYKVVKNARKRLLLQGEPIGSRSCYTNELPSPEALDQFFEERPTATIASAARRFNVWLAKLEPYAFKLLAEGRIRTVGASRKCDLTQERFEAIAELAAEHGYPTARMVGERLGVNDGNARKLIRGYLERVGELRSFNEWQQEEDLEPGPCVLREEWYVCEVCGAGFPGMVLKEDEWRRYLALYEKKRIGLEVSKWERPTGAITIDQPRGPGAQPLG